MEFITKQGHVLYRKLHSTSSLTMTSNCSGFATSCMQQLSTIISLYLIPGYLVATSRQDSKNRPSASFMMFALCTAVTFFLLFKYAYSKAYCAIRSEQNFVITYHRVREKTHFWNIKINRNKILQNILSSNKKSIKMETK